MMSDTRGGDFQVAIVGAGIAGLALAMALHRKNISFTLYEEASEYSAVGAGIGFAPNGMRAMDLIEPGFRPKYDEICVGNKPKDAQDVFFEGMLIQNGLGQDQSWYGKSSWGHQDFIRKSAHRKALLDIMTSFIPMSQVKFKKRLVSVVQPQGLDTKVRLTFEDGEIAEADILAGGDGIQSTVRQYVLGHNHADEVAPVYADAYCYRAVIPMIEAQEIMGDLTDVAKFYFGHKRGVVTYRISGGKEFNYLHCVASSSPWPNPNTVTEKVSHEAMMADFADSNIDERLRKLLIKCNPIRWGLFHHPKTSTYYRGNVVLIGDSAHASLPFQAAGAAQGLEDALVLSSVLGEIVKQGRVSTELSIERALGCYDAIRRPRAQKQLEQSAEVQQMLFFQGIDKSEHEMESVLPKLQNGRFEWLWFHDVEEDVKRAVQKMRVLT